jgi:N-acetylmuramoyl-L-alanine amidase
MKKRISILLILTMMLTMLSTAFAAEESVSVTVGRNTVTYPKANVLIDNKEMSGEMPAILYGDTTMVPVRFITEGIGGEVEWNEAKQEVVIKLSSRVISIRIGSTEAIVDGVRKYIPDGKSPILMNSRTMVPLRFVSEQLGATVDWNQSTKTASIRTERAGAIVSGPSSLQNIVKQSVNGREAVVIKTSKAPTFTHFKLSNPERVVIDLNNSQLAQGEKQYNISNNIFEKVRTGVQPNDVARIVIDINPAIGSLNYDIQTVGNDIVVYLDGVQKSFYTVIQEGVELGKFNTQSEAIVEAKKWASSTIVLNGATVWRFTDHFNLGISNGKTIVIDPGHGGSDPGALSASRRYKEADLALSVGLKLEKELKSMGYNVIMTRKSNVFLTLNERANIANNVKADGFLSIHFNAATATSATGLETFYASRVSGGIKGTNDYQFAKDIQDSLISATGSTNRGVKQSQFAVLRLTRGYAALVELGFITNPRDEERLVSQSYHQETAVAMAKGIDKFFKR